MENHRAINRQTIYKWAIFHGYVSHNQMESHLGDDHPPLRHVPRGLRASRGLAAWPEHLGGFLKKRRGTGGQSDDMYMEVS